MPQIEKHDIFTGAAFVCATVGPFLITLLAYKRLMRMRAKCEEAWGYLSHELARRHDLCPALIELVKRTPGHAREVHVALTDAHAQALAPSGSMAKKVEFENALAIALSAALRMLERLNPAPNPAFEAIRESFATNEDRLHAAQRFFNVGVRDYNERLVSFPNTIIATWFGLVEEEDFVIEDIGVTGTRRSTARDRAAHAGVDPNSETPAREASAVSADDELRSPPPSPSS